MSNRSGRPTVDNNRTPKMMAPCALLPVKEPPRDRWRRARPLRALPNTAEPTGRARSEDGSARFGPLQVILQSPARARRGLLLSPWVSRPQSYRRRHHRGSAKCMCHIIFSPVPCSFVIWQEHSSSVGPPHACAENDATAPFAAVFQTDGSSWYFGVFCPTGRGAHCTKARQDELLLDLSK